MAKEVVKVMNILVVDNYGEEDYRSVRRELGLKRVRVRRTNQNARRES